MEIIKSKVLHLQIFLFLILLAFSMFFSACETAFLSASKLRIRYLSEKKNKKAMRVEKIVRKKETLLTGILIGNNIVNIVSSSLITSIAIQIFGSIGVGLATAFVTISILIFGEILPKSYAISNPETTALNLSLPIKIVLLLLSPFVLFFNALTQVFIFPLRKNKRKQDLNISEEDIKIFIDIGEEEGNIQHNEKKILQNIFKFSNSPVRSIMTPRLDIIAISIHATIKEILTLSKQTSFSRFPVYNKNIDDIKGFVYTKDILFHSDKKNLCLQDILRPAFFTYEHKNISELQLELYKENLNLALVLDEYGGLAGLVTSEDLVEKIIGSIEDEYDTSHQEQEQDFKKFSTGTKLQLPGQFLLEELQEILGISITSEFYDTLAGFILEKLDSVPELGSRIEEQGYEFIVKELMGNKIKLVSINKISH